jgi:hypothetical protein
MTSVGQPRIVIEQLPLPGLPGQSSHPARTMDAPVKPAQDKAEVDQRGCPVQAGA